MHLNPLDVVLTVISQLSASELEVIRQRISHQTPCERNGHKYKPVGRVVHWFAPPSTKLACTACGHVKEV